LFSGAWRLATLLCVNFGWVFFNSESLTAGFSYCLAMLGQYGNPFAVDDQVIYVIHQFGFFVILGLVFSTPIMKISEEKLERTPLVYAMTIIEPLCYGVMFLWAVSFLIMGAHNPFIYFNF
jgi:hypothetical protein